MYTYLEIKGMKRVHSLGYVGNIKYLSFSRIFFFKNIIFLIGSG